MLTIHEHKDPTKLKNLIFMLWTDLSSNPCDLIIECKSSSLILRCLDGAWGLMVREYNPFIARDLDFILVGVLGFNHDFPARIFFKNIK